MDKESLVAAGFHSNEGYRHHEEYLKAKNHPAKRVEAMAESGFVERFDRMSDRLKPLLKPQDVFERDWYVTPEVPLTGSVEGQEFTVFLSIQLQNPTNPRWTKISPYIRTDGRDPEGMQGMNMHRNFCEIWEKSERQNEPLKDLDHVEETVEVYFKALAELSPQQLYEIGVPSDYIPEPIQLKLEEVT
jgi:hypothetical protein